MKAFSVKLDTKSDRALARLSRNLDRPKGYIIRRLIIEAEQDVRQRRAEKPEARSGGVGASVLDTTAQAVEVNGELQAA